MNHSSGVLSPSNPQTANDVNLFERITGVWPEELNHRAFSIAASNFAVSTVENDPALALRLLQVASNLECSELELMQDAVPSAELDNLAKVAALAEENDPDGFLMYGALCAEFKRMAAELDKAA